MKKFLVITLLLLPITAAAQCEPEGWEDVRTISACGVTMHLGIEQGFATMKKAQIDELVDLVDFKCKLGLPDSSPLLCHRAYLAYPAFFGFFYDSYMLRYFPKGWPGRGTRITQYLR